MIRTKSVTGRDLDLLRFTPADVELRAIIVGLSNCCRFAGQIEDFYSVAQHSVLVAILAPDCFRLHSLTHDGSEAYAHDLSRNLKHAAGMAWYREAIEKPIQNAINGFFGLNYTKDAKKWVKAADDLAAVYERVIIRDRRQWHGAKIEVRRALADGYVTSTPAEDMLALAHRLPPTWIAWESKAARAVYGDWLQETAA